MQISNTRQQTGAGRTAVGDAARDATKAQVGPTNFANWQTWRAAQDKADAAEDAAEAKAATGPTPDVDAALKARHDQLWASTAQMRAEVAATEHLAEQLNMGTAATLTAGAYSGVYAIAVPNLLGAVSHTFNVAVGTLVALDGGGTDAVTDEVAKMKQGAADTVRDVATTGKLVGGSNQHAYELTRGPYKVWQAAFSAFSDANAAYVKDSGEAGVDAAARAAADIEAMAKAKADMTQAYLDYERVADQVGVKATAKALDDLGKGIVEGQTQVVTTAVLVGAAEVAPSASELGGELKQAATGARSAAELEAEAKEAAAQALKQSGGDTGAAAQAAPTGAVQDLGELKGVAKLGSAGNQGSIAGVSAEAGAYRVTMPDGKTAVVKLYPGGSTWEAKVAAEEQAAAAAGQTGLAGKSYGRVTAKVNGKDMIGFAMEPAPGGFLEADDPAVGSAAPADVAEAAHWRSKVNLRTGESLEAYGDAVVQKGYCYGSKEIQFFVDETGTVQPIDFQGLDPLPADAGERADQIARQKRVIADEVKKLNDIARDENGY